MLQFRNEIHVKGSALYTLCDSHENALGRAIDTEACFNEYNSPTSECSIAFKVLSEEEIAKSRTYEFWEDEEWMNVMSQVLIENGITPGTRVYLDIDF